MKSLTLIASSIALAATLASPAHAGAVRNASLFTDNTLAANDDGSTGLVNIGFNVNFYGVNQSNLYVNNNGNVTFTNPLGTFTPFGLTTTAGIPIIAAFFADVDTRGAGSGLTQYGQDVISGRNVFGVNWINVGYFGAHVNKLDTFQLIITDRSDTGAGNFDFEYNYDLIQWETGDASNGSNGLGGFSARVGYTNGTGTNQELAGSGINGAFLDGGIDALVSGSLNSNVAGRYIFNVRSGAVVVTPGVPEPETVALAGLGLLAMALARRRKQK